MILNFKEGFHEIDKWGTFWQDAGEDIVGEHETIHTRILWETTYGIVHYFIHQVHKKCKDKFDCTDLLLWNQCLFNESESAHELIATYCGIKRL